MEAVNIAELRNRLSFYLNKVREGQELIVRDRNLPVARIVPCAPGNDDDELLILAAQGKVRLGSQLDERFWDLAAPRVRPEVLRRALNEERDDA